jgi:ParB-like chromosome segregation protein Spo0J
MNELERVLSLVTAFRTANMTHRAFAKKKGLHPSALSRLLRVGELPRELLGELASFERLSRTHLEVIATAPSERRSELIAAIREGRSTYRLRERRETTAVPVEGPPVAPADPGALSLAASLGTSPEETQAFALELLSVLMRSSPERVHASLAAFRAARVTRR